MAMTAGPLPASVTKHLDELRHPLPGRTGGGCVLTLSQASKASESISLTRPTDTPTSLSHYSTPTNNATGPRSDNSKEAGSTGTTGTTLWLGAQIMSIYLESVLPPTLTPSLPASSIAPANAQSKSKPKRAIELGSGIGYLSLYLASKGYDVLATDIEPSLSLVLKPNVENGMEVIRAHRARASGGMAGMGSARVGEIDWMASPAIPGTEHQGVTQRVEGSASRTNLHIDDGGAVEGRVAEDTEDGSRQEQGVEPVSEQEPGTSNSEAMRHLQDIVGDGLDMIITTDTLYAPVIVEPLFRTIYHLSHLSAAARMRRTPDAAGESTGAGAAIPDIDAGAAKTQQVYSSRASDLAIPPTETSRPTASSPLPPSTAPTSSSTPAKAQHPQILIALENRDPALISSALTYGASLGFDLRRIPQSKLSKALKEAGWAWEREDWEGVEVYKGSFKGRGKGIK